jgi:hypothetical protein
VIEVEGDGALKVTIEWRGIRHEAEGEVDEVVREVLRFLKGVCPTYELASKLLFAPDYAQLMDSLSKFLNITQDGDMVLLKSYMPADQSMGLVLLCAHVLSKLGMREDDEMSIEELKRLTGKSDKTVRNALTQMTKDGTVERTGRGSYRITNLGIMRMKEMLESSQEGM